MLKKFALATLGMAFSASAAAVFIPPSGPLVINFNNVEQISASNSISAPSGASEGNWGIFKVSTIYEGGAIPPNQLFPTTGSPVFADSATGQITGIFYGVSVVPSGLSCPACLDAAGGFLDLYWQDPSAVGGTFADLGPATPAGRTGDAAFTDFTDGVFLARVAFASGIDPFDPTIHIRGTAVPSSIGFAGFADSFGNVVTGLGGVWEDLLDTDFFLTAFGTRDVRFRNVYNDFSPWDGGGDIFGATSSDPARVFRAPEPGSLVLLALGLLGIGFLGRRRAQ